MKILGHRGSGVSGSSPQRLQENTLASFASALSAGADGFELDVILSKDGRLMVIHDEELNLHVYGADKTVRDLGNVRDYTYESLHRLAVGAQGEKIPVLEEVLALMHDAGKPLTLNIELKGKGTALPAMACVRDHIASQQIQVVMSSFDYAELSLVKGELVGVLCKPGEVEAGKDVVDTLGAHSLHPVMEDVDEALMEWALANNIALYVWAINEPHPEKNREQIAPLCLWNQGREVLNIITDYPEEMRMMVDALT